VSDTFFFSGTKDDVFVLSLSAPDLQEGSFLGWLDSGSSSWVNAVAGNTLANATQAQTGFEGSFADFQSLYGSNIGDYVGAWGLDLGNSSVWAVIDHNSYFAVVPEYASFSFICALLGLNACLLRRKRG